MRQRKKRMKLPNGFGSIKYLGSGRRNPYAVYPPVENWGPKGPITPKALAYKATWEDAYEVLTTYHMERDGKIRVHRNVFIDRSPLFSEVYEHFYEEKFRGGPRQYSDATKTSTRAAYNNCAPLHDIPWNQIRYDDLQAVINNCPLKHASLELIVSLLHQMYRYALKYEICEKDYSQFLYIPIPEDDESGVPFSDKDLAVLWQHQEDPVCEMLLIMCYSGFRIAAYTDMEINLSDGYFRGGVKTAAGKNRIVPIHSAITDLVLRRHDGGRDLLRQSPQSFRAQMYFTLSQIGIKKHTPHDCRHTFSALCERYNVRENDRKRLLGHSFSDITNSTYGHRNLEELRTEIEKIQLPDRVCY